MISYFNPLPHLWTGAGAVRKIGNHLRENNFRNPLIVTDRGVVKLPFFSQITAELDSFSIFDKTLPNPPDTQVHEGADQYRRENCDCIIAVGGGSPMDCAKGIGVIVSNGGNIHNYTKEPDMVPKAIPYLIAVPTTAGSGSECTSAAIITNTENRNAKMALISPKILPSAAFVDPEIMIGLPPFLTAMTGLDALSHAIEAYLAINANEYTDGLAFSAIRLIFRFLPRAVANGEDIVAREKMAYAQTMAGLAFNCAGLGIVHAMSHPLSAMYGIAHGVANTVLLPRVIEFNSLARPDKTIEIAEAAGENTWGHSRHDATRLAVKALRTLSGDLGCVSSITEAARALGKIADYDRDIDTLVDDALNDFFRKGNPRTTSSADIKNLYAACWYPSPSLTGLQSGDGDSVHNVLHQRAP
jgi:alcohol dehydrogenase